MLVGRAAAIPSKLECVLISFEICFYFMCDCDQLPGEGENSRCLHIVINFYLLFERFILGNKYVECRV